MAVTGEEGGGFPHTGGVEAVWGARLPTVLERIRFAAQRRLAESQSAVKRDRAELG
jgi:hypothetical protein